MDLDREDCLIQDNPLHTAVWSSDLNRTRELLGRFSVHTTGNIYERTPLHCACVKGDLAMASMLILEFKADVNYKDRFNDTPLHEAARNGKEDVAMALVNEFGCDTSIRGNLGVTVLHEACCGGCLTLTRTLIRDHNALANAQDDNGDSPLHVAAEYGNVDIALALIYDFGCDTNIRNYRNRTFLHTACLNGSANIVKSVGMISSPFLNDDEGNTPLHLAASSRSEDCVEAMLLFNPPVLLRNNYGKTSRGETDSSIRLLIGAYIKESRAINAYYNRIQKQAKKKYSTPSHITRLFVVGNCGVGKSSFVATMKKEGLFEVNRSSVPLHTAGIIPSIYISKRYGRVMFYDFAGDPEYYSSHAAILENIASSSKGNNIFIIIVDLREDDNKIRNNLHYWFSFIQYQKSDKDNIIFIGSHSDVMVKEDIVEREKVFQCFFESAYGVSHKHTVFKLDCCKPKSKKLKMIQDKIVDLTRNSPYYKLSYSSSTPLGLLEMDFGNVTACSVQIILDHINEVGIALPQNLTSLLTPLQGLHDIGVLFMIGGDKCDDLQVILNISKLTNEVHKLLFAKDATFKCIENEIFTLNIGVLPEALLKRILPQYITKECLVQLQYCQEISHKDVGTFPSLPQSGSSDQSFLFFPALCSAEKKDVAWTTPPGLSYGIGWLVRCSDTSCDHFPSRFLHVLLLRLVFRFTLITPMELSTLSASTPDHSHLTRRCTMWNSGLLWNMEEGVECTVEMVNGNKGIVVITKSEEDLLENCVSVFNRIVSCVIEAKAEFCYSIKPRFFLIDPIISTDSLNKDNLFSLTDVERVLAEGKEVVLSMTGKMRLKCTQITCLRNFTFWNDLFPLDSVSVLQYLNDVVRELFKLGIYLGLPSGKLDAIEKDFPTDTDRRRIQLMRVWMSSSPDPPCWWLLAQALEQVEHRALAQRIKQQHSKYSA